MATLLAFRLLPLLALLPLLPTALAAEDGADAAALVRLKQSFSDPTGRLEAWSASSPSTPCNATSPWPGAQCYKGMLVGLRLTHMNLSGTFDFGAIAKLPGLHSVNLKHNNFSGPLPASLGTVRSLRALYLSFNAFTGPVPADVFVNMRWLKKLYLDNNNMTGPLPADAIAAAPRLIELHLDRNQIDGAIPFKLPATLQRFNVSHNRLTGSIPPEVAKRYDKSAFAGNPGLCGSPGSDTAVCVAAGPAPPPAMPPPTAADYIAVQEETSVFVVIGIILLVILLVTGAMVLMLRQDERNSAAPAYDYYAGGGAMGASAAAGAVAGSSKAAAGSSSSAGPRAAEMVAVDVAAAGSSSSHGGAGSRRMGEFVLLTDDIPPFGLPDLMKASAEVLGNGTLGSAYKAAMRNGFTVAVKRMRDMNRVGRNEFEQHIHMLGELSHPNVLPPVGYHYRKEEKLIVSEYMSRGSLLYILHGDQSPNRVILDWHARVRIAVGVARGLAFLHEKLGIPAGRLVSMDGADFDAPPPPPHGNLKSGNILLDANMEPRLVDYGFFPLVNAAQAPQAMFAFRSPEGTTRGVVSARSDVYCLGVVLLELVTGRFPSQYLLSSRGGTDVVHWAAAAVAEGGERELVDPAIAAGGAGDAAVRLLRVGVHCAKPEPECRPTVAEAAWMVEEIAAGGAS
ncbi:Pollen receptor-like kinase 3 [Dichanthelium oligosanthes]|uniref:Pollen receptor-like kinase 3 n=1 Tax=Dichanthelium oligosanthes TaxID=888268 RepID=A0A1E5VN99_9POAL|nr:Pollen receptor-like kinase 3 [Dichanthelium oligosanthes]